MAEAAPKSSESMEDILQSIKRIIEDDSPADATTKPSQEPAADVLELTQVVASDGSVTSLPPLPMHKPAKPEPPVVAPVAAAVVPEPPLPPKPETVSMSEPIAPPPQPANMPAPKPQKMEEGLVSDHAAQAALAALKPITQGGHRDDAVPHIPSVALRNGNTVEDLVLEALRPMLKAWLDEHLPLIVQKIVEKEVRRIVNFHKD